MRRRKKRSADRAAAWILLVVVAVGGVLAAWHWVYQPWRDRRRYPLGYQQTIASVADAYELDPYLICGIVWVESRFNPEAVSSVGATGLMQIMPDTGEWIAGKLGWDGFEPRRLTEPSYNASLGGWYLRFLIDRYEELPVALTAYNAGQGRVDGWLADPSVSPDGKTLENIPGSDAAQYARRVLRARAEYERLYADAFPA